MNMKEVGVDSLAPYKQAAYYTYCGGRAYKVCQDGDVLVAREYGVKLGEVRLFFYFNNTEKECLYYAERKFRPFWWPFIAPRIWWRKLK